MIAEGCELQPHFFCWGRSWYIFVHIQNSTFLSSQIEIKVGTLNQPIGTSLLQGEATSLVSRNDTTCCSGTDPWAGSFATAHPTSILWEAGNLSRSAYPPGNQAFAEMLSCHLVLVILGGNAPLQSGAATRLSQLFISACWVVVRFFWWIAMNMYEPLSTTMSIHEPSPLADGPSLRQAGQGPSVRSHGSCKPVLTTMKHLSAP